MPRPEIRFRFAAMAEIPDLTEPEANSFGATGTTDAEPGCRVLLPRLAQGDQSAEIHKDYDGQGKPAAERVPTHCKTEEKAAECDVAAPAGRVSERLKEPVLKTGVPKGTVGSNPTPTAFSRLAIARGQRGSWPPVHNGGPLTATKGANHGISPAWKQRC